MIDYQEILSLVQKSRCKNVWFEQKVAPKTLMEYEIKLVDDKRLYPYNKKKFLVQLRVDENKWDGGLWKTQSVFRYSEDTGLFNLISHADGYLDQGEDFEPSEQMAREVLASCLYHFKKRENNEKR